MQILACTPVLSADSWEVQDDWESSVNSFTALSVQDDEDDWEVRSGSDEPASKSSNRRADAYSGSNKSLLCGAGA